MRIELLVGAPAIVAAAGADIRSFWNWVNPDACDPLRVQYLHDVPRVRREVLEAWQRRRAPGNTEPRVWGWAAIASRVELSHSAAWRAARADIPDRLPVIVAEGRRPWAYEAALDDWRDARVFPCGVHRDRRRALRLARGLLGSGTKDGGAPASEVTGAKRPAKRENVQRAKGRNAA